jgi:hypothetical protein
MYDRIAGVLEAFDEQKELGHNWRVEFIDMGKGILVDGDSFSKKADAIASAKLEAKTEMGWEEGSYDLHVED